MSLADLPSDVICIIFSFLPRGCRVNALLMDKRMCSLGKKTYDPSSDDHKALMWVCSVGNIPCLESLLKDPRVDIHHKMDRAFMTAVKSHQIDIVRYLLKRDIVNPACNFSVAVIHATQNNDTEMFKELIRDARVNPATYNNDALMMACDAGNVDMVRELLKDRRVNPWVRDNRVIKNLKHHVERAAHLNIWDLIDHSFSWLERVKGYATEKCAYGYENPYSSFVALLETDPYHKIMLMIYEERERREKRPSCDRKNCLMCLMPMYQHENKILLQYKKKD